MFCVSVIFETAPADHERFLARVRQQARDSLHNEPGCQRFDVWAAPDKPGRTFLYEIYDSRGAFDIHKDSGHYEAFQNDIREIVTGKSVETWEVGP